MLDYIVNNYYDKEIPDWMRGTRLAELMIRDKWLEGSFYSPIPLDFNQEKTGNKYNSIYDRKPSVQGNFPRAIAGLTSRKLFAGRHVPRLKHQNKEFLLKVQALVEELKMPLKMLEAIKRGSVGSVLILFKFLSVPVRELTDDELKSGVTIDKVEHTVKGIVEIKQTQYCTPTFNQFEELAAVLEHYLVPGYEMLKRGMNVDREGEKVDSRNKYWYVKMYDTKMECVYFPLKEHDWNPIDGGLYSDSGKNPLVPYPMLDAQGMETNPHYHNLGFVQGMWIKNLTGGTHPEGESTWVTALNNFVALDYAKSQNDRGLKYGSAPQMVIKGDLREETETGEDAPIYRDSSFAVRLAADIKTMGQEESSGHDAFLLETNGTAAEASDNFSRGLKQTSFEQANVARKDMESIKGAISGKVIELIDEDFLDLLEELRLIYIKYGYLPLMKKLCKSAMLAGHMLMKGATDVMIDALMVDCPPFYLPDAQEIQFLVSAMVQATETQKPGGKGADGSQTMLTVTPLIEPEIAAQFLTKQLDLFEESDDRPVLPDTQTETESQLDPTPDPAQVTSNHVIDGVGSEEHILSGLRREPIA